MMEEIKYKYHLLTGDKYDFEKELNELTDQGWATYSPMCITQNVDGIEYSILLMLTPKKID